MQNSIKAPIHKLPINDIQVNPFQPREKVKKEEVEELMVSIKTYGILGPLVVAETPAGHQLIAGERRWRAAKELGLTEVPVVIRKTSPKGMLEMAVVENLQRSDLNPFERAQAFQRLIREFGFTTSGLAEKIGKSASYISNTLKLLTLPDALADGLLGGSISEGHARALMTIPSEKDMIECHKIVLKEGASVRRTEELSRRFRDFRQQNPQGDSLQGRPIKMADEVIKKWEAGFQAYFTARCDLKVVRSHRQTKVSIMLKGSPEQTQQDLEKIMKIAEKKSVR